MAKDKVMSKLILSLSIPKRNFSGSYHVKCAEKSLFHAGEGANPYQNSLTHTPPPLEV